MNFQIMIKVWQQMYLKIVLIIIVNTKYRLMKLLKRKKSIPDKRDLGIKLFILKKTLLSVVYFI